MKENTREFFAKLNKIVKDGFDSYDAEVAKMQASDGTNVDTPMPNECIGVVEVPQPDGKPIVIPQYKAAAHPWDKLFNDVTKALTRGSEQEDSVPRIAVKWNCSEEECALRMAELKIARIETGKEKEDSYVDAIGYLVLAYNKYKENQNGK